MSALALGAVVWTMMREKRFANRSDTMLGFGALPPPAPVPEPPNESKDRRPPGDLQALLASVVDVDIPATEVTSGEIVGYTDDEVRTIVSNVLERTNGRGGGKWDLRLVAIDSVRKTVDPYKVLLYELTFLVYIPVQNVGVKLAASVVVPPTNAMFLKSLRTFDPPTLPENDHPRGSFGVQTETVHAKWVPVI
jgi:hypothetical protein